MNIIKFADDRINEFSNGGFHAVNDGKPIEVASSDVAKDLLEAKHLLDGEYVPVFRTIPSLDQKTDAAEAKSKTKGKEK